MKEVKKAEDIKKEGKPSMVEVKAKEGLDREKLREIIGRLETELGKHPNVDVDVIANAYKEIAGFERLDHRISVVRGLLMGAEFRYRSSAKGFKTEDPREPLRHAIRILREIVGGSVYEAKEVKKEENIYPQGKRVSGGRGMARKGVIVEIAEKAGKTPGEVKSTIMRNAMAAAKEMAGEAREKWFKALKAAIVATWDIVKTEKKVPSKDEIKAHAERISVGLPTGRAKARKKAVATA